MRGRLATLTLILLAGCVAPGADVDPASLAALDALGASLATAIPDAVPLRLPNGDLQLSLAGEIAGREEWAFDVPVGVTYVEAAIDSPERPVSAILGNAETRGSRCLPLTWGSWDGRAGNGMRCTGIATVDDGAEWILVVSGGIVAGSPLDRIPNDPLVDPILNEVEPPRDVTPVPFDLTLTFSTQPIDGTSSAIKLDALSKPIHEALEMEVVEVPASSDGVGLHVEITRPDTSEPVPIMLRASPYNGPEQNAYGRADPAFVDLWVPRGYAVAIMDLRGTGKSDGCFAMRGAIDQRDVADVVEFLGKQEWSNGKVGMHGFSYEGFTPMAAAVQQPEHLAAIYIGAPAVDTWSNYLPGGVDTGRSFSTAYGYMRRNAMLTPADEMPPDAVLHTVDAFCDPTILPKANDPRNLYDAWYAERNLTAQAAKVQVPVLFEQGFWDNNVKSNMIPDLFHAIQTPKHALFGSWQHTYAVRADEQLRTLAWFDHWLKGADTGIDQLPPIEVLTNTREWRAADAWPSPDATMTTFALADGSLTAIPPQASAAATGAIVHETEPLADKLYWSGVGLLDMSVTLANGGNVQLEARVHEVPAEGEPIFAGVGWMNAAHRNGHDAFAPFAPGESATIQLKLLPQDHVLQPGSKLRIEIRAATDRWGGPESGLDPPALVEIDDAALHLPTLPYSLLSPAPRSAS